MLWQSKAHSPHKTFLTKSPGSFFIALSGIPDLSFGQCGDVWPFYLDPLVEEVLEWELLV